MIVEKRSKKTPQIALGSFRINSGMSLRSFQIRYRYIAHR